MREAEPSEDTDADPRERRKRGSSPLHQPQAMLLICLVSFADTQHLKASALLYLVTCIRSHHLRVIKGALTPHMIMKLKPAGLPARSNGRVVGRAPRRHCCILQRSSRRTAAKGRKRYSDYDYDEDPADDGGAASGDEDGSTP